MMESCTTEEACRALGGNQKLLTELRNKLWQWLLLQPHLPRDIPDFRLEHFIISAKFSLEQAKQRLDMYYSLRRVIPELFANRDPLSIGVHRYIKYIIFLPKLTPEKYGVTIFRLLNDESHDFQPWEFFKYSFMLGDVRISEQRVVGDVYIYDLADVRLSHLAKLTPSMLKKCEIAATKAYGGRIKSIHFINTPPFVERLVSMVKSALKGKLASRVHVHTSGYDSLYKFVPKSILPVDYGGKEASMNKLSETWERKMEACRDWFLKDGSVHTDETLRPAPTSTVVDLFGFSGSFRKLDID